MNAEDRGITPGSTNLFEDLGFNHHEATRLKIRTDLALDLREYVRGRGWTIGEAAAFFEEPEGRLQDLMNGEISSFTVDKLISLLLRAGMRVKVEVLPEAA